MERQLSVRAAPGIIVSMVLMGSSCGNAPDSGQSPSEPSAGPTPSQDLAPPPSPEPVEPAPSVEMPPQAPLESPPEIEPPPAPEIVTLGDGPTGTVTGRVVFRGASPEPRSPTVVPDQQVVECCQDAFPAADRSLVIDADGGVADVVVTLKVGSHEADGTGRILEMDQACCRFEPHVLVVPVGATVRYKNSDAGVHNVHYYARANPKPNNNVGPGSVLEVPTKRGEEFKVGCDIHPWMGCYIVATKYTTVAKTGPDGRFEIPDVPSGEWSVEIWGERVKSVQRRLKVTVEAGAATSVEWQVVEK